MPLESREDNQFDHAPDPGNVFLAVAKTLWNNGEDGEVIAAQVARTLRYLIIEGSGPDTPLADEFLSLLNKDAT